MKAKFFKTAMLCLGLTLGAVTMASCQSVNPDDAVVVTEETSVRVYKDEASGTKYATANIGVNNNSIYDVYTWNFDVTVTKGSTTEAEQWEQTMYVSHGAYGVVTLLAEVDSNVDAVKINKVTRNKYFNLWDTYLWWWIAAIVIVCVNTIGFAVSVFSNHLTADQTRMLFKDQTSTMVTMLMFGLLLCLFPLFFGSWVSSAILGGAALTSFLLNTCITAIKGASKKA